MELRYKSFDSLFAIGFVGLGHCHREPSKEHDLGQMGFNKTSHRSWLKPTPGGRISPCLIFDAIVGYKVMKITQTKLITLLGLILILFLSGCGGQKLNKRQQASNHNEPLMVVEDQNMAVSIDEVLIKNAESSWVRNASWDEYIISIQPLNQSDIKISTVYLVDAFGDAVANDVNRRSLNKRSKAIKRKYKKGGYKVNFGRSKGNTAIGVAAAVGVGAAAGSTASAVYIGSAATATAGAVLVAIPAALVAGIVRGVNHGKVQRMLDEKKFDMPKTVTASGEALSLIFPAVPAPDKMVVNYEIRGEQHVLNLDLIDLMAGVHLK